MENFTGFVSYVMGHEICLELSFLPYKKISTGVSLQFFFVWLGGRWVGYSGNMASVNNLDLVIVVHGSWLGMSVGAVCLGLFTCFKIA